jgi:hypothetical protein
MLNCPTHKTYSFVDLKNYIAYMNKKENGVSLGDAMIDVKMDSKWRYNKGAGYSKMDSSLDKLCNKLTAPVRKINKRNKNKAGPMGETLIAFGAANVSSVGFGYAHAPQQRLRHRLQFIHNCKVTLIDEWMTSQLLSEYDIEKEKQKSPGKLSITKRYLQTPHTDLKEVTEEEYKSGKWKRMRCYQIYSVRYGITNGRRVYVHRDVNAAKNIGAIYISLVEHQTRPKEFTSKRQEEQQKAGSTTTPNANS